MTLCLFCSTTLAQVTLHEVSGTVEQQRGTWQLAHSGDTVSQALRTGTGRATFQNGSAAQMVMGSSSMLQLKQNEPDLQSGRFYIQGDGRFYINDSHYFTSGKVRVDLQGNVQRIAVIAGSLRISTNNQVGTLQSNQQYDLKTLKTSAFSESDPWYLARFIGTGDAQVQAINGSVTLQDAAGNGSHAVQPPEVLQPGQVLSTAEHAWAEVGFTGGGYLRLQPQSALSVVSIEKTSRGREVQLKLLRGSAWNVVSKGQGGYQITTPTITTAVRGTIFRVDSSGQAKVFDGSVAVPSSGNLTLSSGKQLDPSGQVGGLQLDPSDLDNQALDIAHNAPLELRWNLPRAARELDLSVQSQPSSQVFVKLTPQGRAMRPVSSKLRASSSDFHLRRYLPEGTYLVELTAKRFGVQKHLQGRLTVDRHAPQLSGLQLEQRGKVAHLSGTLTDATGVVLSATAGDQVYQRHFKPGTAAFDWWLPLNGTQQRFVLSATDQAGNTLKLDIPAGARGTQPGNNPIASIEAGHEKRSRP